MPDDLDEFLKAADEKARGYRFSPDPYNVNMGQTMARLIAIVKRQREAIEWATSVAWSDEDGMYVKDVHRALKDVSVRCNRIASGKSAAGERDSARVG